MSDILTYLQMVHKVSSGRSIESVVLQNGRPYTTIDRFNPRPKGIRKGLAKTCYLTAYHIAHDNNWQYVEGFAIHKYVPVQHAWVVAANGFVIEPVWETSGLEYYGIPLELDFIHTVILETETYGVLDFKSPTFRQTYFPNL